MQEATHPAINLKNTNSAAGNAGGFYERFSKISDGDLYVGVSEQTK
jgi:hypothetical protein